MKVRLNNEELALAKWILEVLLDEPSSKNQVKIKYLSEFDTNVEFFDYIFLYLVNNNFVYGENISQSLDTRYNILSPVITKLGTEFLDLLRNRKS